MPNWEIWERRFHSEKDQMFPKTSISYRDKLVWTAGLNVEKKVAFSFLL